MLTKHIKTFQANSNGIQFILLCAQTFFDICSFFHCSECPELNGITTFYGNVSVIYHIAMSFFWENAICDFSLSYS